MSSFALRGLASIDKAARFLRATLATMQPVPDHRAEKTKDKSETLVIAMSATAAVGSNGLANYTGLIKRAQKMKSRINCAQPIRTRNDQATCQPPISTAITNPTYSD